MSLIEALLWKSIKDYFTVKVKKYSMSTCVLICLTNIVFALYQYGNLVNLDSFSLTGAESGTSTRIDEWANSYVAAEEKLTVCCSSRRINSFVAVEEDWGTSESFR
jgi:hypothetical protein